MSAVYDKVYYFSGKIQYKLVILSTFWFICHLLQK